ncbi:MAG: ZIP family metal transporter [Bacteroidales bacterium]
MDLIYILTAAIGASMGSVVIAGSLFFIKAKNLDKISTYLSYLAGGVLLGAAFLGMLPKAMDKLVEPLVLQTVLIGLLFFFLLEKIILWRMCGDKECERHSHATAPLILIGGGFHNIIDGIVMGAAFLTSTELGLFVAISVFSHEIPKKFVEFGVLIHHGFSKSKTFYLSLLAASMSLVGGLITYFTLGNSKVWLPYVLAFSAAGFLYVSLADLIPEMHKKTGIKNSLLQFIFILTGIAIMFLILHHK